MRKMILIVLFLLVFAKPTFANEGVVNLDPVEGQKGSCFVTSVYYGGRYELLGSCREVVLPINAEATRYIIWVKGEKGDYKVGEIVRGKIKASTGYKYNEMFVTAEINSSPRKPSELLVMTGELTGMTFNNEKEEVVKVEENRNEESVDNTKDEVKTDKDEATVQEDESGIGFGISDEATTRDRDPLVPDGAVSTQGRTGVGSVLATIGKVFGIIILLFLGVGAVIAFVSRRRQ